MRATAFLFLIYCLLGLFLWITLSGALFFLGLLGWLILGVITLGYADTMVLFLLGAREVRSSDEKAFFEAASQEAYKLSVTMPRLYFYNGSLERAFILHSHHDVSIILNKTLLKNSQPDELRAICFELLLQVKKGMASKRTKSMFILGLLTWIVHSITALFQAILPFKEIRQALDWFVNYLMHPLLDLVFRALVGESYFRKLDNHLKEYPLERGLLDRVGMKLRSPVEYYSLPSRKIAEFTSVRRSRQFQNIIALEFLPHEWDYLFKGKEIGRAE